MRLDHARYKDCVNEASIALEALLIAAAKDLIDANFSKKTKRRFELATAANRAVDKLRYELYPESFDEEGAWWA